MSLYNVIQVGEMMEVVCAGERILSQHPPVHTENPRKVSVNIACSLRETRTEDIPNTSL